MTLEEIQLSMDNFNSKEEPTSEQLADAYKLAKVFQDRFKATTEEYKLLETFKKSLLTRLKQFKPKTTNTVTAVIFDD